MAAHARDNVPENEKKPPAEAGGTKSKVLAILDRLTDEGAEKVLAMLLVMFPDDEEGESK